MSSYMSFLVLCLVTLAACRPDIADRPEAREADSELGRSGATDGRNPIVEYLLRQPSTRNSIPPGGKREIIYFQAFPAVTPNPHRPNLITGPPKIPNFQRDPNKSPYENFNGFIMAGRKPEENLVESSVLTLSESDKTSAPNRTFTKVDVVPAVATIVRTYDEKGTLRASVTRYEPAGSSSNQDTVPNAQTKQISWPYAGYFPILIKDPFLTAFNTLSAGNSFSFSSLVEYGPEADICRSRESREEHEAHVRKTRAVDGEKSPEEHVRRVMAAEEVGRRQVMAKAVADEPRNARTTRVTVTDPERGVASIRIDSPDTDSDEPQLSIRKGGVSIAGPGGYATAYTGGTAIVGPYGTVFKSPEGVAVAGPYSRIINITDSTSFTEILRMYEASKANKTLPQGRTEENGYKRVKSLFAYKSNRPVTILREEGVIKAKKLARTISNSLVNSENGGEEWQKIRNQTKQDWGAKEGETTLVLAPRSKAETGKNGVAVSTPISHAVIHPGHHAHIVFQPLASASAGPYGFAHAHSDLFISYIKRRREQVNVDGTEKEKFST